MRLYIGRIEERDKLEGDRRCKGQACTTHSLVFPASIGKGSLETTFVVLENGVSVCCFSKVR